MIEPVPFAGRLRDHHLSAILTYLQRAQKTGPLILKRNDQEKIIWINGGDVIFASSRYSGDGLGELLLRTGRISLQHYEEASNEVRRTQKRLGTILVEIGYLKPKELFQAVSEQVHEIILSLFTWIDGDYRFDEGPLPTQEVITLKMSTANLILDGTKRVQDWSRLRMQLPPLDSVIELTDDPLILFQDFRLSDLEQQVLSLVDGKRPISAIFAASPLNAFDTIKLLVAFLQTGLARPLPAAPPTEPAAEPDVKAAETPADVPIETPASVLPLSEILDATGGEPAPAAARPRVFAGEETQAEIKDSMFRRVDENVLTRQKIVEAFQMLPAQNHYEVLGVAASASRDEIKRAYFRLAKAYHPDRHFQQGLDDVKEKLEALFHRITEAYDQLLMESRRKEYDLELVRQRGARRGSRGGEKGQATAALAQVKQGDAALRQGDLDRAVYFYEQAVREDPDNALHHGKLAQVLARFRGRAKDAEFEFKRAIELDPARADNYLGLGLLYRRGGLDQRALRQFEAALQWDPENAQAKEEMAKLKKP